MVSSGSDMENREQRMEIEEQRTEPEFVSATDNRDMGSSQPPLLHMLLMITDGFNITLPSSQHDTNNAAVPPNSYLICKIFCCNPYPRTQPIWSSHNPTFSLRQTLPLRLSKSLLVKMCNNFMVVEIWHKTAGNVADTVSIQVNNLQYTIITFCEWSNSCMHHDD